MTDRRSTQATALALALVITLSIFAGVSHLAQSSQPTQMLAKSAQVQMHKA